MYRCPFCGRVIRNARGMILHLRTHFPKPGGACRCPICGERFNSPRGLKKHLILETMSGEPLHALVFLAMFERDNKARYRDARRRAYQLMQRFRVDGSSQRDTVDSPTDQRLADTQISS